MTLKKKELFVTKGIRFLLLFYVVISGLFSTWELHLRREELRVLTFYDIELNKDLKHPLYTICPVYEESANLKKEDATLRSVMVENSAKKENIVFEELINEGIKPPIKTTVWLKAHQFRKKSTVTLMQCFTHEFKHTIDPGNPNGKVEYFK